VLVRAPGLEVTRDFMSAEPLVLEIFSDYV